MFNSAFEPLQGATIFSRLDLRNAYRLVQEGDKWKTVFNTPIGHFEYLMMPFGLTNAKAVCQALMNDILRDCLNHFHLVCLDDIRIFSRSLEDHIAHVQLVLTWLLENGLYVKAEKCYFHVDTVSFLGYIIQSGQVKADSEKIRAVEEWSRPTRQKELQHFPGFVNFYQCFI